MAFSAGQRCIEHPAASARAAGTAAVSPVCTHTHRCPVSCGISTHLQSAGQRWCNACTAKQRVVRLSLDSFRFRFSHPVSALCVLVSRCFARFCTRATRLCVLLLIIVGVCSVLSPCIAVVLLSRRYHQQRAARNAELQEQHNAASCIQARHRGRKARAELEEEGLAAQKIQASFRVRFH